MTDKLEETSLVERLREPIAKEIAVHCARRPWISMATDYDKRALMKSHGIIPPVVADEMTIEGAFTVADSVLALPALRSLLDALEASMKREADLIERCAKVADLVAKQCSLDLRCLKAAGDDLPGECKASGGQIEALRIAKVIRGIALSQTQEGRS